MVSFIRSLQINFEKFTKYTQSYDITCMCQLALLGLKVLTTYLGNKPGFLASTILKFLINPVFYFTAAGFLLNIFMPVCKSSSDFH